MEACEGHLCEFSLLKILLAILVEGSMLIIIVDFVI